MKKKIAIVLLTAVMIFSIYMISETRASPSGMAVMEKNSINQKTKTCNLSEAYFPQKSKIKLTPEIRSISRKLTREKETELEKIKALHNFVSKEVEYEGFENWRSSPEVLKSKKGNCADQSILLVSLLRSVGIKAYFVQNDGHSWVAAEAGGTMIQVDPTVDNFKYISKCIENPRCKNSSLYGEVEQMFNKEKLFAC